MKRRFRILLAILMLLLPALLQAIPKSRQQQKKELTNEQLILGTWTSYKDHNWKLVFYADGKCKQYYGSKLDENDQFTVSNTTPQCGTDVTITRNSSFLSLHNLDDPTVHTCYEIATLTKTNLTLRGIPNGATTEFYKERHK